MFFCNLLLPLSLLSLAFASIGSRDSIGSSLTSLPTVDLGYGVYRASSYNESYDAYIFSNIRFAAPPTGLLRFGAPQAPLGDRSKIHDGWVSYLIPLIALGPQSEDCLFLDVIVPRKVLSRKVGKVPVLFWIYGGAFTLGTKKAMGDPITFLKESPTPVIWVAANYRLGNLGFSGGQTFLKDSGTVSNAGLRDQRFALQWTHKNIHLFNGDKDEITLMGASAGAGSIMHHITAYGGKGETLFKRAIPLGPGFYPAGAKSGVNDQYTAFETAAGCAGKGVECLREVPTDKLQRVNYDLIFNTGPPTFGAGPYIDGDLVPDVPGVLLAQGRFHKDVTILVTDDLDEGSLFATNAGLLPFREAVLATFPNTSINNINKLLALFPPPSDITPYSNEKDRYIKFVADIAFNCHRYAMSAALPKTAYNLLYTIAPFIHTTGPLHLFQDLPGTEQFITSQVVYEIRRMIMNFVVTGNPNESNGKGGVSNGVSFPVFGEDMKGLEVDGFNMTVSNMGGDKAVCEFLESGALLF